MTADQQRKARGRWLGALKLVFALAVLGAVAWFVPWRDRAVHIDGAGVKQSFPGRIVDDWKSMHVRFELAGEVVDAELPGEWRAQGARVLELERGASVDWKPGLPSVFKSVEPLGIVFATLLLIGGILGTSTRWWRLLAAAGCPTGWFNALRLTLVGFFFNIVVPGLTGGDLIKAVLVAREHPERKAAAAFSVLIDRLIGLLMLALLGAVVIVIAGDKFAVVRTPVLVALAAGIVGVVVYSSPALRRAVGFDRLLARLPMRESVQQIDEAMLIYSRRPVELLWAIVFSMWNHGCVVVAVMVLARAFGDTTLSLSDYIAVTSVGNIVAAVPIAPGGWGVGDAMYAFLFRLVGGDETIGLATSFTFKICLMLIGISGGVFMLLPGGRRELAEAQQPPSKN